MKLKRLYYSFEGAGQPACMYMLAVVSRPYNSRWSAINSIWHDFWFRWKSR